MIEYAIVSAGAFFRLFNENLYVLQGFYRNFGLYLSCYHRSISDPPTTGFLTHLTGGVTPQVLNKI